MRLGFLGGTFNPPHLGHIRAAAAAAEQLGLERLYLIPTGEPPHKQLPEGSADSAQRLEMTRLAATAIPGAEVLDWEMRREGPSYTAITARQLLEAHPDSEIWLLCGTDMFLSLSDWYEGDWLLKTLYVAAYPRKAGQLQALEAKAEEYRKKYAAVCRMIELPATDISSTELRCLLSQGKGGEYLSPEVYAYVLQHRLYGVRPQPEALWPLALPWLKERRRKHVQGCREEAVKLALRWGADPVDAENAAILHDITKKLSVEEQLRLCENCGIISSNFEQDYVEVLHAFSGAAAAYALFGVSEEVRDAIMWHTTGRADMSLLEKVIWLADYIEPARDFPGVDAVRQLAYQNLDRALQLAMQNSLAWLEQKGAKAHPATREALSFLLGEDTKA